MRRSFKILRITSGECGISVTVKTLAVTTITAVGTCHVLRTLIWCRIQDEAWIEATVYVHHIQFLEIFCCKWPARQDRVIAVATSTSIAQWAVMAYGVSDLLILGSTFLATLLTAGAAVIASKKCVRPEFFGEVENSGYCWFDEQSGYSVSDNNHFHLVV